VIRRAAGLVAFGRPSSRRCASSAFLIPRQFSQSLAVIAERINGAGTTDTSWPWARTGKKCSAAIGMSQCSATLATGCSNCGPEMSTSAPSASDVSVLLISAQLAVATSRDSRANLIRSWTFQGVRKKHVKYSRCASTRACGSSP
jgi:hypothetical protein